MDTKSIIVVIIAALISGIIGVVVSNVYNKKSEIYNTKLGVLADFVAYRHDVTDDKFIETINKIFILYHDPDEVLSSVKNFHSYTMGSNKTHEIANQKLLEIFKAMCAELKININELNDDYFLKPFKSIFSKSNITNLQNTKIQ